METRCTEIYRKNLKTLEDSHPHILATIDEPSTIWFSTRPEASGAANLMFKDSQGNIQPLYSETASMPALEKMTALQGRLVCHYGFALGFHAERIVETLGAANIIVLFEAHSAIFKEALMHRDLTTLLRHPNVRLVVGQSPDFFEFLSGDPDSLFATVPVEEIAFDRAMAMAPEWYRKAMAEIKQYNEYQMNAQKALAVSGGGFLKNRFRNLPAMSRARTVVEARGFFQGMPAVIVAAGPSLSRNIRQLEKVKGRALLMAVDAAVGPLLEKEIVPDFVVSGDFRDFTFEKLAPFAERLQNAGLIFAAESSPKVANYMPRKAGFFMLTGSMYQEVLGRILQRETGAALGQFQSVTHLATDFACQAGCSTIIFVGLDLAYDQGRDHAEGTVLHWGNRQKTDHNSPMALDIHGRMVPTHVGFLNMLTTFERMIRETPDRTWVDATEGGLLIAGTRIMSLAAAIDEFCTEPVDIGGAFDALSREPSTVGIGTRLDSWRQEIQDSLSRIDAYFEAFSPIDRYCSEQGIPETGGDGLPGELRNFLDRSQQILTDINKMNALALLPDLITGSRLDACREHRAKVMAATFSGAAKEVFAAILDQQKLVQQIRKDGLTRVLTLLEKALVCFQSLEKMEKTVSRESDPQKVMEMRAAFYFSHGFLWLAEQCLNRQPLRTVQRDFYLGAIRLRRGDVTGGLALMQASARKDAGLVSEMERIVRETETEWLSATGLETFMAIMRKRLIRMGPSQTVVSSLWPKDVSAMQRLLSRRPMPSEDLDAVDAILSDWSPARKRLPRWWTMRAEVLNRRGKVCEALDAVETAIGMGEGSADSLALSARLMIEAGRFDEGIARLQKAVMLAPRTALLWEEIGDALLGSSDFDGAIAAYERCLSALPDRLEALKKVGDCYAAKGEMSAAKAAYEAVLNKSGNR